jgi:hypothetical protein
MIVANGQPFHAGEKESLGLTFERVDAAGRIYSARVDREGNFSLNSRMPPGKYRVTVVHQVHYSAYMNKYPGSGMGVLGGGPDKFQGAFQGKQSPLTVEVTGSRVRLKIDLTHKTVTTG